MHSIDHTHNCIELVNVSFSYEKEVVLKDVNLPIHSGDYFGVIGPNGGGKTTLLKIILGLLKPDKGTVKLFGQNIETFKDWSKIGYVPQKVANFDRNFPVTVKEVVMMGRFAKKGLFRFPNQEDQVVVKRALDQVEMGQFANRLVGDLSGGQLQRVFIARALASQPEIIILDEPTVGVDFKSQEIFYTLLKKLNTQLNLTLVLVSHDINIISSETTELAFVNKTLSYYDSPDKFFKYTAKARPYGRYVGQVEKGM